MSDAVRRGIRGLVQFIAAGGLTALINDAADGLSPRTRYAITGALMLLITFCQNYLEERHVIPALLKGAANDSANPKSAPGDDWPMPPALRPDPDARRTLAEGGWQKPRSGEYNAIPTDKPKGPPPVGPGAASVNWQSW